MNEQLRSLEHYVDNLQVRIAASRNPTSVENRDELESLFIESMVQLNKYQAR